MFYTNASEQVITGNDLEQRAFACFTLARCIIASASDDDMGTLRPVTFDPSGCDMYLSCRKSASACFALSASVGE
jgi:hypothetical protein